MSKLDKIEERFLEAMGIEKKNEMFFDTDRSRVFLFAGAYRTYYDCNKSLKEDAIAYESGNDVLALIDNYTYRQVNEELIPELKKGIRISRGDLWYNLGLKGTESAHLSVAYKRDQKKEAIEKIVSPKVKPFGECPIKPFEKSNLDYYYIFDTHSLGLWIPNLSDKKGITLSIGSCNTFNHINCDGETINVNDYGNIKMEFNYENFVTMVEKYMWIVIDPNYRQALTAAIEFMCRVVIPSMLEKEIIKRKETMASYNCYGACEGCTECDEEKEKIECLEKIYEEFAKYAIKDDEECAKTIYKRVGEVRN